MNADEKSIALARVYGNVGTLYSKCGGVFGVSSFVDRCMDKWMADPTLNANQAVTTWHAKAQRCGFKFLVVQIVCNLTGGPQVYTGRPIDVAHKHLNISEDEWDVFMELFNQVCSEFGLPPDIVDDLNALMISMEVDCVVYPGEDVPRDPGPARPSGSSLYARVGGVYPLALFADRIVDALLDDERVEVPVDVQKRNEASLKYLFTELVCNICGGPEVVTSRGYDETMLLVPKVAWRNFIATAEIAADHLPRATRPSLIQALVAAKSQIVDPTSAEPAPEQVPRGILASAVKDIRAAANGRMLSREAIAARHAAPGALVAARKRVLGDPRTLYGRGGGVFGLARLADALMDAWMSDDVLNHNTKVARWHESQQKCGFKFLVTQIMSYLTGGPQRYTGRPMDEAHKHLEITGEQWSSFMKTANNVFETFGLDGATQQELCGILSTYQSACVLAPGEEAPADPGLLRPTGNGSTLYQRLGGVYPIAQFVDRLVESVLKGDRVQVQYDRLDDATGKRHPPGLKYMMTELVCSSAGGPEVVTSKGFDEAKLGVQAEQWPAFLELASAAAQLWPISHLRNGVVAALGNIKAEICIGVIDEDMSPGATARRKVQEAGFDHYVATAALEKAGGNAGQALDMLARGWTPEDQDAVSTVSGSVASLTFFHDPDAPRCPFARAASGMSLPPGHPSVAENSGARCPFARAECESERAPKLAKSTVVASRLDEKLAAAAGALMERGMDPKQVASLLGIDEASVMATSSGGSGQGRVLGNELQEKLDKLLEEDPELCCPVSLVLFVEPVIASDGFLYEKSSLQGLLKNRMVSPMTREVFKKDFTLAKQRRSNAMEFRQQHSDELLTFAEDAMETQPGMAAEALQRATEYIEVLKPSQVPNSARRSVSLWQKLGQPIPTVLQDI